MEIENNNPGAVIENIDIDDAAFDAAWNDDDDYVASEPEEMEAEQPEADQPEEEPAPEQPAADQPAEQPAAPALYTIKNRDQTRQVTIEELQAMAQKGWDYDAVRTERDQLRQFRDANAAAVEFLESVARQNGMDIAGYLNEVQKRELMRSGLSEDEAKRELQMRQREEQLKKGQAALDAQREKETAGQREAEAKEAKIRRDIAGFMQAYPSIKPAEIPKEVWDKVNKGDSLVAAYAQHEAAVAKAKADQLEAEVAALKQNKSNAQRSPGRLGGNSGREMDEIDRLWAADD